MWLVDKSPTNSIYGPPPNSNSQQTSDCQKGGIRKVNHKRVICVTKSLPFVHFYSPLDSVETLKTVFSNFRQNAQMMAQTMFQANNGRFP